MGWHINSEKMKKQTIYIAWTCLALLFVNGSCTNNSTKSTETRVELDTIHIDRIYHLMEDSLKPACNLHIHFEYPAEMIDAEQLKKVQSLFVEKTFGAKLAHLRPEDAADLFAEQYIDQFKELEIDNKYQSFFEEEDVQYEGDYLYYLILNTKVAYVGQGFVSFTVENTSYAGGAHNTKSIYGYTVNLATDECLQESDFESKSYENEVAKLLVDKIASKYDLENPRDLENLGYMSVEEIRPNNNFTISDKGLTYYFNENEIAGTMVGLTEVFIPYNELSIYLASESPLSPLID